MPFQELSDSNPVDQTISDCKVKAKLETAKKPTPQFEANLSDSAYIVQTEQPQSKVSSAMLVESGPTFVAFLP